MVESETGGVIRVRHAGWVHENGLWVQRLYVGEKIASPERRMFPYQYQPADQNCVTGSIGFLDFLVQKVYDHSYDIPDSPQMESAVELVRVGLEPAYHGQGYGLAMVEVVAEKARDYGISFLVAEGNPAGRFPHLRSMEQLGFVTAPRFSRGVTLSDFFSPRFAYYAEISSIGKPLRIPELPSQ